MYKKQIEIVGHAGGVYTCKYDQHFIYTGSADTYVTRWLLEEGLQDKFAIKMDHPVYAIEMINNRYLAVGLSSGSFHVFDLKLRQEIKHFTQHIKAIFSITVNEKVGQLYVGDADGNLSIWDISTFELLIYLPLDCGKIRNIRIGDQGRLFVVSCQDGTIRVFETERFNEIITINAHKGGATIAQFHPLNSELLLTGGKDALLNIWNWQTGDLIKSIPAHNYVIYDLIFIEKGLRFVTASRDKTIKIWDSKDFTVEQRLDFKAGGHRYSVNSFVKLSETSFASASDDKKLIVWTKAE